jgi:hypothetical protein
METREQLIIIRNIFFRCFLIGLFFLFAAALIYMPCKCFIAGVYQNVFGIATVTYYNLWVGFLGLIKTILIFLFLTPALAIHLTIRIAKKLTEAFFSPSLNINLKQKRPMHLKMQHQTLQFENPVQFLLRVRTSGR